MNFRLISGAVGGSCEIGHATGRDAYEVGRRWEDQSLHEGHRYPKAHGVVSRLASDSSAFRRNIPTGDIGIFDPAISSAVAWRIQPI